MVTPTYNVTNQSTRNISLISNKNPTDKTVLIIPCITFTNSSNVIATIFNINYYNTTSWASNAIYCTDFTIDNKQAHLFHFEDNGGNSPVISQASGGTATLLDLLNENNGWVIDYKTNSNYGNTSICMNTKIADNNYRDIYRLICLPVSNSSTMIFYNGSNVSQSLPSLTYGIGHLEEFDPDNIWK